MKRVVVILVMLSTLLLARTQWVRVFYHDEIQKNILIDRGYDILSGNGAKMYFDYFLDETAVQELKAAGFAIKILHPDIISYLEEKYGHLRMNFGYHYTYAEMVQELDEIASTYPNLTHKVSIGQSWEGREVWALKVSDNASQNEGEPSVLITGVLHAREPIGCGICMDFINWLLDNYGTNDTATTIINNDEVWIVPVVNPDGYVFNETYEDPWGSGWRKNCRDNNNNGQMDPDYDGVDLNRNFGYQWGYDNQGSSPDPASETYRGPEAFSEPETQHIRVLCDTFDFMYALNYHSYADVLIVPWGYINSWIPAADSAIYHFMADTMTTKIGVPNNYPYGTAGQTIGYNANGTSDDWMYGEQVEKPKCFAFTAEVGQSFWEGATDTSIIVSHCNKTRPMNIYLCYRAAILGVNERPHAGSMQKIIFGPNPTSDILTLQFYADCAMPISLQVYDTSGRLVIRQDRQLSGAGYYTIAKRVNGLSAGVYFVQLVSNYQTFAQSKLVIVKD